MRTSRGCVARLTLVAGLLLSAACERARPDASPGAEAPEADPLPPPTARTSAEPAETTETAVEEPTVAASAEPLPPAEDVAAREKKAAKLLAQTRDLVDTNPVLALMLWNRMEEDFSDTPAYAKGVADDVPGRAAKGVAEQKALEEACARLRIKARNLMGPMTLEAADRILLSDPDFQHIIGRPGRAVFEGEDFKEFCEKLKARARDRGAPDPAP